jgi:riboflavin synthase
MFTGLVEEVGEIAAIEAGAHGARVRIRARRVVDGTRVGDSIAVDGACLTVTALDDAGFAVDAVPETLARTVLGRRRPGDAVNLERALRVGDRLGGHMVQGHVDGTGTVARVVPEGEGLRVRVDCPEGILRYVVEKGSITVDGVSLTVAERADRGFVVALIPHTLGETTLGGLVPGRDVNLEADMLAKYVEALVGPHRRPEGST